MSDNLTVFGLNYNGINGIKAIDTGGNEITYSRYPIQVPGPLDDSPVKFIDYDGTVLYSYSAADFLALNAMPANPSHTGLIAQGWNWTLAQAQSYVNAYGTLTVGQLYRTSSGKTELDITLAGTFLTPYVVFAPNGTAVIDWGDGSATSTVTGTSYTTYKRTGHTYASAGTYTISINVTSGKISLYTYSNDMMISNSTYNGLTANQQAASALLRVRIGDNVTEINQNAFQYCTNLESVTMPTGFHIGANAFKECRLLKSIVISDQSSLSNYAFDGCHSLRTASFGYGLTGIGQYAFRDCKTLESVTLPSTVTTVSTQAFGSCFSLRVVVLGQLTAWGDSTFQSCYALRQVTIPSGTTAAGASAFSGCSNLQMPVIPSSMKKLGGTMFGNCYAIKQLNLTGDLEEIGSSTFTYCKALQSVVIGDKVTSIQGTAFNGCYALREVHVLATTPPTLGTNAFQSVYGCIYYVPSASLTAYQTASNWSALNLVGE